MLLVFWIYLDLIISGEAIHDGHPLETACIVNYDFRDRERELIFGTSSVQIVKVYTNLNLFVLLEDGNNVAYLVRVLFFPDETGVYEFFDFQFDCLHNLWIESSLLLLD